MLIILNLSFQWIKNYTSLSISKLLRIHIQHTLLSSIRLALRDVLGRKMTKPNKASYS